MIDKPRIGYASKTSGGRLFAPTRYLPIIIVPGIMGTRLTDPKTGNLAWNPLGFPMGDCPKGFVVDYSRMTQISAELIPDETHGPDGPSVGDTSAMAKGAKELGRSVLNDKKLADPEVKDEDKGDVPEPNAVAAGNQARADAAAAQSEAGGFSQVRHFANLVVDFYGDMIKALLELELAGTGENAAPIKPRIYACGYDWRQDNARSALRLAQVVEEALAETRERKVIIIAHGSGGHVARYYSRALGGEGKILRMFLIGSPIMGFPEAYSYLKHGVPGLYVRDFIENTDAKDRVAEGISEAGSLSTFAGGLVSSVRDARTLGTTATDALGKRIVSGFRATYGLFFVLCLGAGRYLRRKETLYFVRQMPALYQLLPSSLYCRDHKNWLFFDPMATGHLPTGYMLVFPTTFEALIDIIGFIADKASPEKHINDKMKGALQGFFAPGEAARTSPMATLMKETIEQRFERLGKLLSAQDPRQPRFGVTPDEAVTNVLNGMKSMAEVVIRVTKFFVDARASRTLYSDIYTGLMDLPEHRALAGGSLAMAYRLDEALTVDPCPVDPLNPLVWLLNTLLLPAANAFSGVLTPGQENPLHQALQGAIDAGKKTEEKQALAKAYIHPATVIIYCASEECEAGSALFPTDIVSDFDSNRVEWMLLPGSLLTFFMALASPGGDHTSGFMAQEYGDGTVPVASANPPAEALSAKVLATQVVPGTAHMSLCGAEATRLCLKAQLLAAVPDFLDS